MYVLHSMHWVCSLARIGGRRGARLWRRKNSFLKIRGFSSSLSLFSLPITLASVLLIRPLCDGITITYRRYIRLPTQIEQSLLTTLGTSHWRGTAKWNNPVETSERPTDEWWKLYDLLFERVQLVGQNWHSFPIQESITSWYYLLHVPISVSVACSRKKDFVFPFPALPNQSIATGPMGSA